METYYYNSRYSLLYDIYYFFLNLRLDNIFIEVLEASLAVTVIIPLILIARKFLSASPKKYSYLLWSAVFIRLIIPININFPFSLGRDFDIKGYSLAYENISFASSANAALRSVGDAANGGLGIQHVKAEDATLSTYFWEVWILFGKYIWLLGILIMVLWGIITYIKLNKKLSASVYLKENIYVCDYIETALVKGIFRPKIYLSSKVSDEEARYIVFHEKFHLSRHDNIIKFFAFVLLSIHWFNPLMWLFFICISEDMELSCDEAVLSYFGGNDRQEYSGTILNIALKNNRNLTPALYFGEGSIKKRLKNAVNYRKAPKWLTVISVTLTILLLCLFITSGSTLALGNPQADSDIYYDINTFTSNTFLQGDSVTFIGASDNVILKTNSEGKYHTFYAIVMHKTFQYDGEKLVPVNEVFTPAIIETEEYIKVAGENEFTEYKLLSYYYPEEGGNFEQEVREQFPRDTVKDILNMEKYREGMRNNCTLKANNNFFGDGSLNKKVVNTIYFSEHKLLSALPEITEGEFKWVSYYDREYYGPRLYYLAYDNISADYVESYIDNLLSIGYETDSAQEINGYKIISIKNDSHYLQFTYRNERLLLLVD